MKRGNDTVEGQFDNTSLRNIRLSGGLFTENMLLRLRDYPEQIEIGKIKNFLEKDTEEQKKQFKKKRKEVHEWCIQKWDAISPKIEDWTIKELISKWIIPFLAQLDLELENFTLAKKIGDVGSILGSFSITHQSKNHKNPFFHFIIVSKDFDSKINSNPLKRSHHDVCQQFINLNPEIRWLFLSNGRILRVLTKYYHTYSKGYLEFDIENILANRDIKEFEVLYSIIHSNRYLEIDGQNQIDLFQEECNKEGVKVGDTLRDNVHKALELLGNGLIKQNSDFHNEISLYHINLQDFYAELLRIIYRLIFILYAEQRGMLPGAGTLYFDQFSLSSLRILSEKPVRADKNNDLWQKLFIIFDLVKNGTHLLEINSYNGALFSYENLQIINRNNLKLSNDLLLKIIRLLTSSKINNVRQRINFREVSEEEIGSIYESLLDFKPYISSNAQFRLIPQTTERKSTGSYYTPKELIDILIRTTLRPLIEERLKNIENPQKKEEQILNLKICDPACGGGTFLLAALDYLGKILAEVRIGEENPPENDLRLARRDILQHCIYGVDKNPLAVELAKISLWLRVCVKDKPLNFLDNHIKCGNSLLGLGQKIEINEINPNAFHALTGNKATGIPPENKNLQKVARERIRKENKLHQLKGKTTRITAFFTEEKTSDICSKEFQKLIELREDSVELINEKEEKYEKLKRFPEYQQALNEANIWTSTFFWPLDGDSMGRIPNFVLIDELRNGLNVRQNMEFLREINAISEKHQFFHWYVEFPEVFASDRGGFDCILTNPPWDTLLLKEMEFFTGLDDEILSAPNQSERRKRIIALRQKNPSLFNDYMNSWVSMKKMTHFLTNSGLYDLSAKGSINKYAIFFERGWRLISPKGFMGIITPTGLIMNYNLQNLFRELVEKKSLLSIFDFINQRRIFNIHRDFRFCLLSVTGESITQKIIPTTFFTLEPKEIQEPLSLIYQQGKNLRNRLKDLPSSRNLVPLEQADFELFNPNTITCPSFKIKKDAELLRHLYRQAPILLKRDVNTDEILANPWEIRFKAIFHLSNDSDSFITLQKLNELGATPLHSSNTSGIWIDRTETKYFPLYEGRMIWLYNHRYNSIGFAEEGSKRKSISIETKESEYKNPNFSVNPNYWVSEKALREKFPDDYDRDWFFVYRNISGATNERTMICSIIPFVGVSNSIPLILLPKIGAKLCCFIANFSSIVFDYIIRRKISGTNLNYYIVEQLPVFPPDFYTDSLMKLITPRVIELIYNSNDLKSFAEDCGFKGQPYKWDVNRRLHLQAEIDAIYALLYRVNRNDLIYILDTFKTFKKREIEKYNEYKIKNLILESFDTFSEEVGAIRNDSKTK